MRLVYEEMKLSRAFRHVLVVVLTLLGSTACDQGTKYWARHALIDGSVNIMDGKVRLILTSNRGAFLSFGDQLHDRARTFVFTYCVSAALLIGVVWLLRHRHEAPAKAFALSLVFGGGIGNVLDRALNAGAVTDFLFLRVGPMHTGIFNVADMCISTGMLIMFALAVIQRLETANRARDG